jgi:hypothetical protein
MPGIELGLVLETSVIAAPLGVFDDETGLDRCKQGRLDVGDIHNRVDIAQNVPEQVFQCLLDLPTKLSRLSVKLGFVIVPSILFHQNL